MIKEKRPNRDIQNLLVVLGAAIVSAGLIASLFLYYYGSTGRYMAGQTMLDPSILNQINYLDHNSKTGKKLRLVFDRIEFSYFDPHKGQLRIKVTPESYQKLYRLISSERSIEATDEIKNIFLKSPKATLTATMRTVEKSGTPESQIFQQIEFVEDNYFRVLLHEKSETGEWAYFYRRGIFQNVIHLFTQDSDL